MEAETRSPSPELVIPADYTYYDGLLLTDNHNFPPTAITVDGATIINDMAMMNMFADNGVVLAIDRVLLS